MQNIRNDDPTYLLFKKFSPPLANLKQLLSPKLGTARSLKRNVRDTQGETERNIFGEMKEQLETNSELLEEIKPTAMA